MLEDLERDLLNHRNAELAELVKAVASGDAPPIDEISAELARVGCTVADFCELARDEIETRADAPT